MAFVFLRFAFSVVARERTAREEEWLVSRGRSGCRKLLGLRMSVASLASGLLLAAAGLYL